jgi:hypothetical protein
MRYYGFFGSLFAAAALHSLSYPDIRFIEQHGTSGSKRVRPGKKYPHSSTRQNARIARQWAAGQLDYSASKFKGQA